MARSGRSWVVAAVMLGGALAACGGQSSDPTVLPPVLSTTRPSGFGGTLPVETTSTLAPTIAPTVDAAVTTVAVSTTDEAALRARVLEYELVVRDEVLNQPNPDYERLRQFNLPSKRADVSFSGMESEARAGTSYRLNNPDVHYVVIENLTLTNSANAEVTYCVADNAIKMGPGPDRLGQTSDDVIIDPTLGAHRYIQDWAISEHLWLIAQVKSAGAIPGASCVE